MSKVHRQAHVILAMLLVCITAITVIECQVHTAESTHEHTMPSRHHSHDASGHTAMIGPCLLAILPFVALPIICTYLWFYSPSVLRHYVTLVFSLFIPPRRAACALLASSR